MTRKTIEHCLWCDTAFVKTWPTENRKRYCSQTCQRQSYYYERRARESEQFDA